MEVITDGHFTSPTCVGREASGTSETVATDPFMMFIAPVERFEQRSGFATANFCEIRNAVQVSVCVSHFVLINVEQR